MADVTSIIESAMAGLDGGTTDVDTTSDTSDAGGTDAGTASGDGGSTAVAEISPSAGSTVVADKTAKPAEVDELTKELESLGIKAPKDGERENRLPYSRVRKIVENAQKKLTEAHKLSLSERETRLTAAEKRVAEMDRVDALIAADPTRYMQMLALLHPNHYGRYTQQQQQAAVAAVEKKDVASEPPAPDHKFEDGSLGYTPEQYTKLMTWNREQARKEAVAETEAKFNERFGPMEREWKAQQVIQQTAPKIRAQIEQAKTLWGKPFEDDYALADSGKSEILKYMQANPRVPFDAAVANVLIPKIRADRNTMRDELLTEMNARPKAAQRSVPSSTKADVDNGGAGRSTEDIIREAMAGLK